MNPFFDRQKKFHRILLTIIKDYKTKEIFLFNFGSMESALVLSWTGKIIIQAQIDIGGGDFAS